MQSDCILFDGYRMPRGYGRRTIKGKMQLAHRVAYCEHKGISLDSIKGLVVRHRCDNPGCVNPEHLEIGTQGQNVADAVSRDRYVKGERHPGAKINSATAIRIRGEYKPRDKNGSIAALSRRYGLSTTQIHRIVHGERWKSVA